MLAIADDNVLAFLLMKFVNYVEAKNKSCTMRYYETDAQELTKCGVVEVNENDRIAHKKSWS